MGIHDPVHTFIAGQLMSAGVALVGMMAAFNWATFLERGDQHGVRSYHRSTLITVVYLFAFPVAQILFEGAFGQ